MNAAEYSQCRSKPTVHRGNNNSHISTVTTINKQHFLSINEKTNKQYQYGLYNTKWNGI